MSSTRSRHGCWTCRRRHQKCGEEKPSCQNCLSRGAECGGYAIELAEFSVYNGPQGQMVSKITRGRPDSRRSAKSAPKKRQRPRKMDDWKLSKATEESRSISSSSAISQRPFTPVDAISASESSSSPSCSTAMGRVGETQTTPKDPLEGDAVFEPYVDFAVAENLAGWLQAEYLGGFSLSQISAVEEYGDANSHGNQMPQEDEPFPAWDMPLPFEVIHVASPPMEPLVWEEDECNGHHAMLELGRFPGPLSHAKPSYTLDDRLVHHFINNLSVCLYPVEPSRNPYRYVYGHLAKESQPLHESILLASAMHLSRLGQLDNSTVKPYRMARQTSFREAIRGGNNRWGLGLTVLLSVVFDIIGTGMDSWSSKLVGCRELLQLGMSETPGLIDAGRKCVVMQFNWVATMAKTLMVGVRPFSSLEAMKCIDTGRFKRPWSFCAFSNFNYGTTDEIVGQRIDQTEMAFQQQHWWANMPDFRMHLLLRQATDFSTEVYRIKTTGFNAECLLRMMPQVADLVRKIQSWHPDLSSVTPDYTASVAHFNELWRQGLLCYVYHDIYSLGSDDDKVQGCIESSLEALENLTWLQACLWPVFMLAVHARTERARNCFEAGLILMHTTLGFTAPKSLVLILQRIWDSADAGLEAKWREVVDDMGIELNILL
ncbi:hypothetical protein ACJ41O_006033 [Fusarium nematophilum]